MRQEVEAAGSKLRAGRSACRELRRDAGRLRNTRALLPVAARAPATASPPRVDLATALSSLSPRLSVPCGCSLSLQVFSPSEATSTSLSGCHHAVRKPWSRTWLGRRGSFPRSPSHTLRPCLTATTEATRASPTQTTRRRSTRSTFRPPPRRRPRLSTRRGSQQRPRARAGAHRAAQAGTRRTRRSGNARARPVRPHPLPPPPVHGIRGPRSMSREWHS